MDDIYMVILTITMPIVTILLGAWRIKKSTKEMIDDYIENLKNEAKAAINDPKFPALLQSIGAQLAQGMMQVGGKEIKNAIPKFKLNDIIGVLAMKLLGGGGLGNLGSLLGGSGGEQQQDLNSGGTVKSDLE